MHVNKSLGTGSSGNCLLRVFSQSLKVFRAQFVFLSVFLGINPLQSVKSLPSLMNSEKRGGAVREAGLGPATELEVELRPMAEFRAQSTHTCQGRRAGHGCSFSNLSLPR